MKNQILTIGLSSLLALTACNVNPNQDNASERDSINPTNVYSPNRQYNEDDRNLDNGRDDFGFTRMDKARVEGRNVANQTPSIDREQIADIITTLSLQLPDVNEAATLVTDEDVLVVYDTNTKNRNETADQVKRTAMSVVPRYYHVYVSDNAALAQNIENYSTLQTDSRDVDYAIKKTIKEMLKSPQGRSVSKGENANGEMKNEKNNDDDNMGENL